MKIQAGSEPIESEGRGQLPLWHERVRGLPNPIARSSLFTVGNQNEAREFYRTHKQIQTLSGYTITYRGEELRQSDEDVWLQLIHLSRLYSPGGPIEFSAYSFIKALGWAPNSRSYDRLRLALDRLQGTGIRIVMDAGRQGGYQGALVRKFAWKDDQNEPLSKWVVWLEPEIVTLFSPDGYSQIWWDQRLKLKSPLAKFLHSYYATHAKPHPMKVETIKELSGSRSGRVSDFKKSLKAALTQLQTCDFLDNWAIDSRDLVSVDRKPKSQNKSKLPGELPRLPLLAKMIDPEAETVPDEPPATKRVAL